MSAADYNMSSVVAAYAVTKLITLAIAWLSGYVAETHMSELYQRQVFIEGAEVPPRLWGLVNTMLVTYLCVTLALTAAVTMGMYTLSSRASEMWILFVWMMFDALVTSLVLAALGGTITKNVTDRRYFNYKLEGLRAIRAVRKILVNALLALTLVPFACALGAKRVDNLRIKLKGPIQKARAQVSARLGK